NDVVERTERHTLELDRISRTVGKEGKIHQRMSVTGLSGGWAARVESVNSLIEDLVHPTSETARVIGAVAEGDLSQSMAVEVDGRPLQGEFLRTARTVNTMVKQLGSFASEVTRVAREVGIEGKLGGQAKVKGVAGTWKDLTDNVNTMVDQLSSFASEVTRVAREVGTEGKLGGQAQVKGVSGTWKDPTDNVNSMASNLTGQVRNIAEVTTAVANGDLTKTISADAQGEILELKNTI